MKLVIGTANFLNHYGFKNKRIDKKEAKKIFSFCKKNKITHVDTAFSYDSFRLIKKIKFKDFKISSKINFKKNSNSSYKINDYLSLFNDRIKEFKIQNFETFFVHNFDDIHGKDLIEVMEIMKILKKKKLINKIGISIYDEKSLKKTLKFNFINTIQVPLNLSDRRFLNKKYLDYFKKKKINIQARSVFLQGILLEDFRKLDKKNCDIKFIKKFNTWIQENKITKKQACINFVKSQKNLDSIIFGVENLKQLKEILAMYKNKYNIKYPKDIFSKNKNFFDLRNW
jgi:aryl-alcohol dehydrogenase-like predicted oxidoreductase